MKENCPSQIFTLSELNLMVRDTIRATMMDTYWITAEIGELKENSFSHHCYLELIEKRPDTNQMTAKARAVIWANKYPFIKYLFESRTGETFAAGIKILIRVSVDFHELYGFSLSIEEIEPSYTIGEMHLRKSQIIAQLQEEGIFSMNKELNLPLLPVRIAVISSPSAAGYGDFMSHLDSSPWNSLFAVKLFAATMQGEKTEASIIQALESIHKNIELFDAIVIIRGGGATSDLNSFDSYDLAANCAQFPLPILTGIGHERDDSIVDLVAHTRLKTPTAVADFLINRVTESAQRLNYLSQTITSAVTDKINETQKELQFLSANIIRASSAIISKQNNHIIRTEISLKSAITREFDSLSFRLKELDQFFRMASPSYILQKGYALVLKEGKVIESSKLLDREQTVELRFSDGSKKATIQ
ncbi:MAG: exodeoxyribonuclease VII large subunit [Bacteroidales bacterium]|nr:exodeoxyribonuclease VII large subunit [Bacteroidales bacterium]